MEFINNQTGQLEVVTLDFQQINMSVELNKQQGVTKWQIIVKDLTIVMPIK